LSIDAYGAATDLVSVSRSKQLLVTAFLLVAVVLGATASPAQSGAQKVTRLTTLNRQIADAINFYRQAHGLAPLTVSAQLNAAAQQHSEEMAAKGYFDHDSADGTAYWKRIESYYPSTNYSSWSVGENLAYGWPSLSAAAAMKLWITSAAHRANLKHKSWRDLGVSAVHVAHAGGVYGGNSVTIITTDFGARH
jgi:uncharacterized protein YkwD